MLPKRIPWLPFERAMQPDRVPPEVPVNSKPVVLPIALVPSNAGVPLWTERPVVKPLTWTSEIVNRADRLGTHAVRRLVDRGVLDVVGP